MSQYAYYCNVDGRPIAGAPAPRGAHCAQYYYCDSGHACVQETRAQLDPSLLYFPNDPTCHHQCSLPSPAWIGYTASSRGAGVFARPFPHFSNFPREKFDRHP